MTRLTPSQGFDPELADLFREGALRVIRIDCKTKEAAIRYRARMNRLRLAMRKENRSGWENLYRASLHIDPSTPTVLVVQPVDHEFVAEIRKVIGEKTTAPTAPQEIDQNLVSKFLKSLREHEDKA